MIKKNILPGAQHFVVLLNLKTLNLNSAIPAWTLKLTHAQFAMTELIYWGMFYSFFNDPDITVNK